MWDDDVMMREMMTPLSHSHTHKMAAFDEFGSFS